MGRWALMLRFNLLVCCCAPLAGWLTAPSAAASPVHAGSRAVAPALLETDLPRIESYLQLDEMQAAAARVLLQDQLELDEAARADLLRLVQNATVGRDTLEGLREQWASAWDPRTEPLSTPEGRAACRQCTEAWIDRASRASVGATVAGAALQRYIDDTADGRAALFEHLAVLLDARQQARLHTIDAAAALARSRWPAVLPQERCDLDALLVKQLGDEADHDHWVSARAAWLQRVGRSRAQRDARLEAVETRRCDAVARRQPELELLATREAFAAHEAHAKVLDEVRAGMAEALEPLGKANAFQRAAHGVMHPASRTHVDRLFDAALAMDDLDGSTRAAVQAAAARHRSRVFFVEAQLADLAPALAHRRALRSRETALMRRMYGPFGGMQSLSPEHDARAARARDWERRLDDVRQVSVDQLHEALGDERMVQVHDAASVSTTRVRDAEVARAIGRGELVLPGADAGS